MSHPGEPPASHPSPPTEPNLFADNSAAGTSAAGKPDFMVWPTIPDTPRTPRTRRRGIRLLVGALITVVALAAVSTGTFVLYQHHLDQNIDRIGNPFQALPEKTRPKPAPSGATNILMLGSDRRISAAPGGWVDAGQHTDSIMIAHVPADRARVTVTSIPRDSWVTVPGHGKNKINAGFGLGGPTLMVRTVENLTGVRIDHLVIVDFDGFKDITDEIGGVRLTVPRGSAEQRAGLPVGPQTMNGETALRYVRQRNSKPGNDFAQVERQQSWIHAVAQKTLDRGTLLSPFTMNEVLTSLTRSIAADDQFTIGRMRSLTVSLRGVRGDDLTFLTAPVTGTGRSPAGQSVVKLDAAANRSLWKAVADDDLDTWLSTHPEAAREG
jgi:LCP family protein required for cell wall assembly